MVLKIEGMSCQMCAKRVTKALEGVAGEGNVVINLEEKTATLSAPRDREACKAAVAKAGYEVVAVM